MDSTAKTKQNNTVILSCITGLYDYVKPTIAIPNTDWLMFSDRLSTLEEAKHLGWKTKLLKTNKNYNYRTEAKFIKWLPEKYIDNHYRKALWVDGSIQITNVDIIKLFFQDMEKGLRFIKHPNRYCIYDEVQECWDYPKYRNTFIRKQLEDYSNQGIPKKAGLWAFTLIGHDLKNKQARKLCEEIKKEDNIYQTNDQVAGAFIFWKHKFVPEVIDIELSNNPYFNWLNHNRLD